MAVILVSTFGKMAVLILYVPVLILVAMNHHHMLGTTTTVSLHIKVPVT